MFKKLGSKLKEQKGFTLIELLAVIVILGIIAAIAIPAISGVINKSDKKAAAQEGVAIINAAKMWVAEHPDEAAVLAGKVSTSANKITGAATTDVLDDYLDHIKDNTFVLTITRAPSAGKYSFFLTEHDANTKLEHTTELSEQDLIDATK
ncbi:prepilin-type N-terminal cleavage/methylation domain-containing protein [Rhodococcus qingshengii]|nr:prepilin-type N-terminal cleavage/methylation domain-containing protein [Rhodococcus qingshengii]